MSRDFRDLLSAFNAAGVEYLVVGAHALAGHGHVRATHVLDVWVRPEAENARRVLEGLKAFGAPLHDLGVEDLTTSDVVFQIGVAPLRIDVLTSIDGVEFAEAWAERFETRFADVPTHVLSRAHLVRNKRASGRPQDLVDADRLERGG